MSERLLLIDSDIFVLLSAAGMLETVIDLLGYAPENARRLQPLPHMLRRGRAFSAYSDQAKARAEKQCTRVSALTDRPRNDRVLDLLSTIEDIGVGEALLYALLAEKPGAYLASGDKRAMIALAADPALQDVRRSVAGRVVCLEAALKLLVERTGVKPTARAFSPLREVKVNTVLRVVFSSAEATTKADCLEALNSYLADLDGKTGGGFLYRP
ncbi:hypothetical protein LCGC14_2081330 [marine sediment metagenome]|uniref:Uncharacterized protein n=1 Tax=marine sediment metagenome TaxID=412755 RepID=A0A0F9EFT1_9ZZZZ